jgi:hypothetical protein
MELNKRNEEQHSGPISDDKLTRDTYTSFPRREHHIKTTFGLAERNNLNPNALVPGPGTYFVADNSHDDSEIQSGADGAGDDTKTRTKHNGPAYSFTGKKEQGFKKLDFRTPGPG